MNLKLIGIDSRNGIKILKNIKKVEKELDYNLNIDMIPTKDKNKYNIKVVPTLLLNGIVISEGSVIGDRELRNFIKPLIENV